MPHILDVNYDRSEMMLQVAVGKNVTRQQISSNQINSIQIGQGLVKSWIFKKTVPQIEIHLKGKDEPLILQSGKTKMKYEQAESIIRQFAEKNDVPFAE